MAQHLLVRQFCLPVWLGLGAGLVSWAQQPANPSEIPTLAPPPLSTHATQQITYEDVTDSAGLSGFRHVAGEPLKPYLPEITGSGVALFDYNNDGWLDIYLVNSLSHAARRGEKPPEASALFRNTQDGSFRDVTSEAGVGNHRWGTGVCAGDFDNDGWEDLYVGNLGRSRFYRNNGDGTFTDVAEDAGVAVETWATGCAFGDYDRDGDLDLYVAGYVDFDWNDPPPAGESAESNSEPPPDSGASMSRRTSSSGMGASYDPSAPYCTYLGLRVACGPRGLQGAPDFLFQNNGDGTFTDVTQKAGVEDRHLHYGFSVAWVDLDNDGRLDLVVANDSRPNLVYHSQADGTFEEVGILSGLATNSDGREQAYMGMAAGDFNRDGRQDFFFTTFSDDSYTLHRNNGDLDFTEMTAVAGLAAVTLPFLGWGAEFLDYDNDGWLDIFAANGHAYPQIDRHGSRTSYRQRALLFRNLNGKKFEEVTANAGGAAVRPRTGRGAAVGDVDNDGDLDIVLNNLDAAPTLLRNEGGHSAGRWITLKLVGDPTRHTPRDAIGAVVYCESEGARQKAEVASGRGYISQSDLRVHFGLGSAERVEKIEVLWPNGEKEAVELRGVDDFYTIIQGKGLQ